MNAPANTAHLSSMRAVAAAPPQQSHHVVQAGFFDLQGFELLQRVAKAFANSTLVPAAYQGNLPNCMIALNLARRLRADELMVMQNLYIVHGNPGWSSKFLIASVNTCGRFNALRYEWRGKPGEPGYGCRAWTVEKLTGDRLDGIWVDWKMVKAEGWDAKKGSKWLTMPDQMFVYRSAAFWTRAYAPEISMGLMTEEEIRDVVDVRADGSYTVSTESLRADMARVDADGVIEQPTDADPADEPEQGTPQQQPAFDPDAFAEKMARVTSVDILDLMADEIRDLPVDDDMADSLTDVYKRRRAELVAAPTPAASRRTRSTAPAVE